MKWDIMLNYLWAGMILVGLVYSVFAGTTDAVNAAMLESAKEAVTLCLTMLGVMSFWTGLMAVAKAGGIIQALERLLRPVLRLLFPDIPPGHPAGEYITSNMIANLLDLGWAATPFGLKAMKELKSLEEERAGKLAAGQERIQGRQGSSETQSGRASDEMCTFLIINISSLQLIPVNVIAYRSQYGSTNPTRIIGVSVAVTLFSTLVAAVFCKVMQKKGNPLIKK